MRANVSVIFQSRFEIYLNSTLASSEMPLPDPGDTYIGGLCMCQLDLGEAFQNLPMHCYNL